MSNVVTNTFTQNKLALLTGFFVLLSFSGVYLHFYFSNKDQQEPDEILYGKVISFKEYWVAPRGDAVSVDVHGYLAQLSIIEPNGKEKIIEIPVSINIKREKVIGKEIKIARYNNWLGFPDKYMIHEKKYYKE